MIDLEALKALAQAATSGPWAPDARGPEIIQVGGIAISCTQGAAYEWGDDCNVPADAAYVAAASPDAILALVARLEAAERVVEAARVGARCHEGKGYSEEDYAKAAVGSSLGQIQVLRVALAAHDAARVKP